MKVLLIFVVILSISSIISGDAEESGDNFVPEYPKVLEDNRAFKRFIGIVDTNGMNVTLIVSNGEYWKNGQVKEVVALSMDYPANKAMLKKSDLTDALVASYLSEASDGKLAAAAASVVVGQQPQVTRSSNSEKEIPKSKAKDLITTIVKDGRQQGFAFDEDNYGAQYTFVTTSSNDLGNATTKVFVADIKVDVVVNVNVPDAELGHMKKLIAKMGFMYSGADIPKMIGIQMDEQFPGNNWQVALNAGKDAFIDSNKYAVLKAVEDRFTVFAIEN